MREILFRGKRIDNGEWLEGYYGFDDNKPLIAINKANGINGYFVAAETVGQYTGLTDKSGKKIFEGDILKEDDVLHNGETQIKGRIGTCSFEKGCWVILFKDTWDFLQTNINVCSAVGNIHDNPELLEEQS